MFFKTPVRSLKFISFDIKSFFFLQSVEVQEKKAKNKKTIDLTSWFELSAYLSREKHNPLVRY